MSEKTEDRAILELFGAIVTHNVEEASRTTNTLLRLEQDQTKSYAKALVQLAHAIERIPTYVRSVEIQDALDSVGHMVDRGEILLGMREEGRYS